MNNYDNHIISKFNILINDYNIRFFTFIFHMTHVMQSLNVNVFKQYKY